jgi:hypothetical protein
MTWMAGGDAMAWVGGAGDAEKNVTKRNAPTSTISVVAHAHRTLPPLQRQRSGRGPPVSNTGV